MTAESIDAKVVSHIDDFHTPGQSGDKCAPRVGARLIVDSEDMSDHISIWRCQCFPDSKFG